MSRKFVIVNHSATLRKIIRAKIRANIDDAVVYEAESSERALLLIRDQQCHLALYIWDGSDRTALEFFHQLQQLPESLRVPFLLLTTDGSDKTVGRIAAAGIRETLTLPCPSLQLAETLNRVCNPVTLRRDKRYAFQDTLFLLEQRGHALEGSVINASLGGMLCEIPYSDRFNWSLPATASINFCIEGETVIAPHLYSVVVQITVTRRHPDFSPKLLRVAFKFLQVPEESRRALEQVFERVRELETISGATGVERAVST